MKREIITDIQGISLVILFILGSTMVLGTGVDAGRDSWIAIIISIALSFPLIIMYGSILKSYPNKDLYQIIDYVFGKYIGKIITVLYIWFSFHLGALVTRNFGEFIVTVSLKNTPKVVPMTILMILCFWGIKSGIEVLGRWSILALVTLILLISFSIILLIPTMNLHNIQPILGNGVKPVMKGAISTVTFPFAETVIFLLVFSSLKEKNSSYKVYIWGLIIGGIIVFSAALTEILVLGENEYTSSVFPSYKAISRVNIGNFIQRIEIIVSINLLVGGFIKICICLMATCRGIAKLLDYKDYRFFVIPISLLMINLSLLIYDSATEMFEWAFSIWVYYALSFQVIIPSIIFVGVKIKTRENWFRRVRDE